MSSSHSSAHMRLLRRILRRLLQSVEPTVGSEADTFKLALSVRVSGLAYDRIVLEKIIKNKIKAAVPIGSVAEDENNRLHLNIEEVDIAAGRIYMTNNFQGTQRPDFDNNDFKYALCGKSEQVLKEYIKHLSEIKSVRVQFTPPWLRHASWLSWRIFIRME